MITQMISLTLMSVFQIVRSFFRIFF